MSHFKSEQERMKQMNRIVLTLLIAMGIAAPAAMRAHDASMHKGKATSGEIVSVGDDRFELKTPAGTVPVTFSTKTKFEHGKSTVDKTHLRKGKRVSVIGTKLPNGDLVAKEVLLGLDAEKTESKASHKH